MARSLAWYALERALKQQDVSAERRAELQRQHDEDKAATATFLAALQEAEDELEARRMDTMIAEEELTKVSGSLSKTQKEVAEKQEKLDTLKQQQDALDVALAVQFERREAAAENNGNWLRKRRKSNPLSCRNENRGRRLRPENGDVGRRPRPGAGEVGRRPRPGRRDQRRSQCQKLLRPPPNRASSK